jgi:hypothetical protein
MKISEQKAYSGSVSKGIAKPLVSRRLSAYNKLKAENEKLKHDIYNLVRNVDKTDGIQTKMRYEMQYKMSDAVWYGDVIKGPTQFSGILGCLSNGG